MDNRNAVTIISLLAFTDGTKAAGSASTADFMWADCRELAGQSYPEGVTTSVFLGPTSDALFGCRAGMTN